MRSVLCIFILLLFVVSCDGSGGETASEKIEQNECIESDDLFRFLNEVLYYKTPLIVLRHEGNPVLRFAEGTSELHQDLTKRSVDLINLSLPDSHKIEINDGVTFSRNTDIPPNGEIYVNFAEKDEWPFLDPSHCTKTTGTCEEGTTAGVTQYYRNFQNLELSAQIWIDPNFLDEKFGSRSLYGIEEEKRSHNMS